MTGAQSRIVVLLDSDRTALSGAVRADGVAERPFSGWLGLLSALQTAVEGPPAGRAEQRTEEEATVARGAGEAPERRGAGEEGSDDSTG